MASGMALCASANAAVQKVDLRLHHLVAPVTMDLAGTNQDLPETARSLVSASQWGTVRNPRLQTSQFHLGRLELITVSERFRTPRADVGPGLQSIDRISGRAAEIGLTWPIAGAFSLQSELRMSHIKRQFGGTPDNALSRPISMGMIGVGMARGNGPSLMLGYQESRIGRGRSQPDRIAALAGGRSAGKGMRLELSSGSGDLLPHHFRASFALSSMQRPLRDDLSGVGGASVAGVQDRRVEIAMRLSF